ncbi:hypothetical protein STENM223S_03716 [Streptomyces tendae]
MHTSSAWVGHKISRLQEETGVRVAFVTRLGQAILPSSQTVLQEGDLVHVMMRTDEVHKVEAAVRQGSRRGGRSLMRVAIAGAGAVGRSIAGELLENGHEILLIDKAPTAISVERVPMAERPLADACAITTLDEAALQRCDVQRGGSVEQLGLQGGHSRARPQRDRAQGTSHRNDLTVLAVTYPRASGSRGVLAQLLRLQVLLRGREPVEHAPEPACRLLGPRNSTHI